MSVSRVTEKVMHGLTGGGWKRKHPATVNRGGTAWRETTGTQAPGPTAGQRHRASRPPYSGLAGDDGDARIDVHEIAEDDAIRCLIG